MNNKITDRLPKGAGAGTLDSYPAVQTPWNKLISFYDAYAYACRHHAGMGAVFQEVLRILVPDYDERADLMCRTDAAGKNYVFNKMKIGDTLYRDIHAENHQLHPFFDTTDEEGGFRAGAFGDLGDERLLMNGRVNDFGTYRVEKELDTCPWDIMGSEICRVSTTAIEEISRAYGKDGEFNMVEARGCGDLHCRLIYENRKKYPMPEREKIWDNFGPIATADQIKFTPEEECVKDPQTMRCECGFKYRNGMCEERNLTEMYNDGAVNYPLGSDYCLNPINTLLRTGKVEKDYVENLVVCLFEGSGKMMFLDSYAKKGLRDWLGVPDSVHDGRILGAYIEVLLQTIKCEYDIVSFDAESAVYDIDEKTFMRKMSSDLFKTAYLAMWYGMSKTLLGPEWSVWEESSEAPEGKFRIKIEKKIDKFCR
jgi:hypothetical protein